MQSLSDSGVQFDRPQAELITNSLGAFDGAAQAVRSSIAAQEAEMYAEEASRAKAVKRAAEEVDGAGTPPPAGPMRDDSGIEEGWGRGLSSAAKQAF